MKAKKNDKCWWHVTEKVLKVSADLYAMPLLTQMGKAQERQREGEPALGWRAKKDCSLQANLQIQCCWWFQKCDWLLSGWTEAQKVYFTTTAVISSVSCLLVDTLVVFPLLICVFPFLISSLPQVLCQPISTQLEHRSPLRDLGVHHCLYVGQKSVNTMEICIVFSWK